MEHTAHLKIMRYIAITGLIIILMSFATIAEASLVSRYNFSDNTGSTLTDSSGNGNDGTITGAAWSDVGINGTALYFDGNDYVALPVGVMQTPPYTVTMWVATTDLTSAQNAYTEGNTGTNTQYATISADTDNKPYGYYVNNAGSVVYNMKADNTLGRKYNFITIRAVNNTYYQVYVNGVLVGTDTDSIGTVTFDRHTIGAMGRVAYTANYWTGYIDEMRMYDSAFSVAEMTSAYQEFHPIPTAPYYGETVTGTYPPLTTSVNVTWIDDSTSYGANELIVSKDSNFNIIVYDTHVSVDYANLAVENGVTYYWKVRQYNSSTGAYGRTTTTQTFSVSTTSASHTTTAIEGIIYEIDNGAQVPIDGATVLIYNATWSSSAIVGSNGYYLFNNLANGSTYNLYATKTDYANSNTETVTTANYSWTAKNILMKLSEPTWFEPNQHYVKFIVMDFFGNYKKSVAVSVYKGSEASTSFTGTTGDDGSVTFYLKKDQSYRITFVNASQSINKDMTLLPSESQYYIITSQTPTKWWDNTTYSEFGTVAVSVTTSEINSTHAFINVSYNDSLAQTSGLMFYVNQTNHTNVTRPQIIIQSSSQGTNNNVQVNFTVANYKGQSYIVNIQATHTTFASISRSFGVRFEGLASTATDFLGDEMKAVISFGFIFFVAAFFGQGSVAQGAGATAVIAWVFFGIGWLAYFDPLKMGAGITLATIVAFLAIIDERKKAEGMV